MNILLPLFGLCVFFQYELLMRAHQLGAANGNLVEGFLVLGYIFFSLFIALPVFIKTCRKGQANNPERVVSYFGILAVLWPVLFTVLVLVMRYTHADQVRVLSYLLLVGVLGLLFGMSYLLLHLVKKHKTCELDSGISLPKWGLEDRFFYLISVVGLIIIGLLLFAVLQNPNSRGFEYWAPIAALGLLILKACVRRANAEKGSQQEKATPDNAHPSPAKISFLLIFLCSIPGFILGGILVHYASERDRASALSSQAGILVNEGQFDKAISLSNLAIELDPKNVVAIVNRGVAYLKKKQFDLAIVDFNQALLMQPNDAKILNDRGVAYMNKNDYNAALKDLNEAIQIDPNYGHAFVSRGQVYIRQGLNDKGLEDCVHAKSLEETSLEAIFCLGIAHKRLGQYEQAVNDFNEAIRLTANNASAPFIARSEAYVAQNEYGKAIAGLDQAIHFLPNNADLFYTRGQARLFNSDPVQAVDDLTKAVSLDASDAYKAIWLHIAHIHAGQDDQQDLENNAARFSDSKWPAPVIALYQGKMPIEDLYKKARNGDATAQRDQICEANFYIGEYYLQRNMKDDAEKSFHAADHDCPEDFTERRAAHVELKFLGVQQ